MTANYLATAEVDYYVGTAVRQELCSETAGAFQTAVFLGLCRGATARVQAAIRNSGYEVPTASAGTGVDQYVKMATVGVWVELAYSRPEKHVPLPPNWENHFLKEAADDILSGDAMLDLAVSTTGGIGSGVVSEYSTSISSTNGSRQNTFSRKNMSSY
jgi:hypothetical protein